MLADLRALQKAKKTQREKEAADKARGAALSAAFPFKAVTQDDGRTSGIASAAAVVRNAMWHIEGAVADYATLCNILRAYDRMRDAVGTTIDGGYVVTQKDVDGMWRMVMGLMAIQNSAEHVERASEETYDTYAKIIKARKAGKKTSMWWM